MPEDKIPPYKADVEIVAAMKKKKKNKKGKDSKPIKLKDIIKDIQKKMPKNIKEKVIMPTEVTGGD